MPAGFRPFTMRYSNTKGVQREHPAWQAMSHFFNHQTHHRGQVTTLLMQAGVDPGVTDLLAMVGTACCAVGRVMAPTSRSQCATIGLIPRHSVTP